MSSYKEDNKLIAFFRSNSYDYAGRYLFTASMRREGSSEIRQKPQNGVTSPPFPLGWRISEESFMEGTRSWLDDLKIRADFGCDR